MTVVDALEFFWWNQSLDSAYLEICQIQILGNPPFFLLLAIQAARIHSPSIWGSLIAAQRSIVQPEPRSHTEHVTLNQTNTQDTRNYKIFISSEPEYIFIIYLYHYYKIWLESKLNVPKMDLTW